MGHAHAAADGHVPAGDVAGVIRDRDVAEVMREDIDVVRGRHRHHDLEFARQIGLAVDRLDHLAFAARDALAVEPDLAIGRRMRQQMIGDRARQLERRRMRARLLRQQLHMTLRLTSPQAAMELSKTRIDRLHRRLQVRLDDAVQLDGLARGEPHRAVAVVAGDLVEREPLLRRQHPARDAHADHEGERLLHLLAGALGPQVAVVLQVHAVELHQLLIVLDDRAGDLLAQALLERAAQIVARFLDALVARQFVGHRRFMSRPIGGISTCPADSAFRARMSPPPARPLRGTEPSRRHKRAPARRARPSPSPWHRRRHRR